MQYLLISFDCCGQNDWLKAEATLRSSKLSGFLSELFVLLFVLRVRFCHHTVMYLFIPYAFKY